MPKREPFVAPPYRNDGIQTYSERLAAAFESWANQTVAHPTPEPAKPYAAMARGMAADFLEALGWSGYSQRIRNCSLSSQETAAIEALRAKLEALLQPVDRDELSRGTDGYCGTRTIEKCAIAGFTIIKTPGHD